MDRKDKKKASQKALVIKNKKARFITEYVKRKNPQLYLEGETFYNRLQQEYPQKRDHTKTHEFLTKTTKYKDYHDFYSRKKLKQYAQKATTTTTTKTTTTTTIHNEEMQLCVELLPPEVAKANTGPLLPPVPEDVYQDLLDQIRRDPQLRDILDSMPSPPDVWEQAEELVNDPELEGILDQCQETPLERELSTSN